jgi:hypothetical protein
MEIISWTDGNHSMDQWKSFQAPMEIIPWIHGSYSKTMMTKDMEPCIEVIISLDE